MTDTAHPGPRGGAGPPAAPAPGDVLFRLVEAVAALPAFQRRDTRELVTGSLRPDIAMAARQDERPLIAALGLVQACLDRESGLRELLETLHLVEGDSEPMRRVVELALALPPERGRAEPRGGDGNGGERP
ncbi:hypothetical protein [Spirillospora sp. NPDC029432]|uniref:effector-associated domain 2-containing protein n=1 Tax=Spirillospora sp. NPDC029432 TaxID=3154599 RepID=UPI00345230EE